MGRQRIIARLMGDAGLSFYNTLARGRQDFAPVDPDHIRPMPVGRQSMTDPCWQCPAAGGV